MEDQNTVVISPNIANNLGNIDTLYNSGHKVGINTNINKQPLTVDDVDHDGGGPRVGRRARVVARVEAVDVVDGERGHDGRGRWQRSRFGGGRGGRSRHPHLDLEREVSGLEITRCIAGRWRSVQIQSGIYQTQK